MWNCLSESFQRGAVQKNEENNISPIFDDNELNYENDDDSDSNTECYKKYNIYILYKQYNKDANIFSPSSKIKK